MIDHIPPPRGFFESLLRVLDEHPDGIARKDVHEPVADRMGLSPALRAIRIPSGKAVTYRHRTGWAFNVLKHAGLARSVAHGVWGITDAGKQLLAAHPGGLSIAELRDIGRQARESYKDEDEGVASDDAAAAGGRADPDQTPEERIESAVQILRSAVARELLEMIGQASPAFFETLVLDLLHALGYGTGRDDLQRVGGSGDGGIDGIIALDKLGLEKVYVQAKRWRGSVGRPDVQGFYGALAGRRARKGVFITTSSYTREAREFAESVSDSIVLIDGARLAELMIDQRVGVNHDRAVTIPSLDSDYFEDA